MEQGGSLPLAPKSSLAVQKSGELRSCPLPPLRSQKEYTPLSAAFRAEKSLLIRKSQPLPETATCAGMWATHFTKIQTTVLLRATA